MSDTLTITKIDQSTAPQGFVTVTATVNVSGQIYNPQPFVSNFTDPVGIADDIKGQAETFRAQVLSSNVAPTTTVAGLVGEVINI